MKKNISAFCICAFAMVAAISTARGQKVHLGLHFDPLLSWMSPDGKKIESQGVKFGNSYGLELDYDVSDNYAIGSGFSITNTAGQVKYTSAYNGGNAFSFEHEDSTDLLTLPTTLTYSLGHIELPLTMKLKTNEIGYFIYYGQIGLILGMNIKARGVVSGGTSKTIDDDKIPKEVKFFNMGLKIGAGAQYSLGGKTYLVFGLFYNNGFLDVTNDKGGDEKVSMSYFALRLGVLF